MERATAIKTLGKLLGKSLGYRVDHHAPSAEEREQARTEAKLLSAALKDVEKAETTRREAILADDGEYQHLKAEVKRLHDAKAAAWAKASHFKFTVGTSNSLFFHVKAQGDSWEDVIAQLRAKEVVR